MNEVNQPQNIIETQVRQKFSSHEWVSVKSENENIKSKFYIKKEFYHEHKTNSKKLRYNKRNPTKTRNYYERHPIYKDSKMLFGFQSSCDRIYQNSLPNSVTYKYEGLGSRIYNCNFTSDGSKLLVTTQHGTSSFKFSDDNHVEMTGMTQCPDLNWSITDSDISSDNKLMVHSTLSPNIHLYDIEQGKYFDHFAIKSNQQEDSTLSDFLSFFSLRIYCLKLSSDKNQIIAGCGKTIGGAPIQVYDLEANKVKNSIVAHSDDINSITYLNKENSTMFISASDDGVSKLWDTRILENNKPVGIFYGHVSGITYVSSKEDDRYFITNCKDQSIKLWDIRKAITQKMNYPFLKFDYRYEILSAEHIEEIKKFQQKIDHATMTFWGHQVHMSLIRCHFSPLYGTAQRYIYTGSFDGRIYIYDTISGQNVMCLEQSNQESAINGSVIRDCKWHPFSQTLVSTNFLGELHRWEYLDIKDSDSMEIEHEAAEEINEKAEEKPEFAQYRLNDDDEPVVFERSLLRDNM